MKKVLIAMAMTGLTASAYAGGGHCRPAPVYRAACPPVVVHHHVSHSHGHHHVTTHYETHYHGPASCGPTYSRHSPKKRHKVSHYSRYGKGAHGKGGDSVGVVLNKDGVYVNVRVPIK